MYFIDNKTWSLISKQEMSELEESACSYSDANRRRDIIIDRLDGLAMILIVIGVPVMLAVWVLTGQWIYTGLCLLAAAGLLRLAAHMRQLPKTKLAELQLKINSALIEVPEILQNAIRKFYYDYHPADFGTDRRNANKRQSDVDMPWPPTGSAGAVNRFNFRHSWIEEFPDQFLDLLDTTSDVAIEVGNLDGTARARFFDEFCLVVRPTLIRIAWLHGQKIGRYDMSVREAELQAEMDQHEADRRAKFDKAVLVKNLAIMAQAMNRTTA